MYHQERSLTVMERLTPKPLQQLAPIFCREHVVDGVFLPKGDNPFRDSEQKQVMVSQHYASRGAEILDESKNGEGGRSAIYQVADEPQSICRRIKVDAIDELIELLAATLDIADSVSGHGWGGELAEAKVCGRVSNGNRASITLLSPPRAANVPVTFAHTGRQALTTSCKMRLTAFS